LSKVVLAGCTLLALLILTIVPITEAPSITPKREPASSPPVVGHNLDRSSAHSSVHIGKLSGDFRLIVILVEFTDIKHKTSDDQIQKLIVERMNKYWLDVSYDQFNVISDTLGWFELSHDEAYYGRDTSAKDPGSDQRDLDVVADACNLAGNIDFNQYQSIMVVFAGHGQDSDSKNTDLLWPSAWWDGLDATCGSKTFTNGGFAPEVTSYGTLDLGGFTHEFGHTIDLPDLYDTAPDAPDYWRTRVDYVGMWSLMASGSWGGPEDDGTDPIGLESWSRIKLGWLSSLSIPLTPGGFVQQLNQLGDTSGPRALKLQGASGRYYLFEARTKVGVDKYVPDSGVLITLIDESKDSGQGIVNVQDCHPETKSIDDATCGVNDSWSDTANNIYMKVIGQQETSYTVVFASKPITILEVYTAEFSLVGVPSSASANVTVDGVEYAGIAGSERLVLVFPIGSTHTVTLSQCAVVGEDTRYCTTENTVAVSEQGIYSIHYDTKQYRLLVETRPSFIAWPIEKWFTAGQTKTVGPYDETVPVSAGIRYFLPGLTVDNALLKERMVTLRMDQPHIVKVSYVTQYFLKITSAFGDPRGEGWYAQGDVAEYSVITPYGVLIQHFFVSWMGDVTSTQSHGTLTMTQPYAIEAKWRDDYTQLWVALVAVAAVTVGFLALRYRKAKKITPTISVGGVPTSQAIPTESGWFCINCGASLPPDSSFCEICGARQQSYTTD
jgi:M6 family metalloprotease-like protein